ncbi:MAG: hypothetical protein Q9188_000976 [Gyalolechia gomerana]
MARRDYYDPDTLSDALRQEGNALYRANLLQEAVRCYTKAAGLAPTDPTLLSNLSAANYEIGDYQHCIDDILKALELCTRDATTLRTKLYLRLIKCYLPGKDYQAAIRNLAVLEDHPDKAALAATCKHLTAVLEPRDRSSLKLILQLPRYLSTLHAGTEHYVVGHDDACQQVNDDEQLSALYFLFAAAIVPPYVADRIQRTIKRAVVTIQVCFHLGISEIMRLLVHYFRGEERVRVQQNRPDKYRNECKSEIQQYKETGALWPPASMVTKYEPSLGLRRQGPTGWKNIRSHICQKWHVNVTMLDDGWGKEVAGTGLTGVMSFDPFRMLVELYEYTGLQPPKDASLLYDFVIPFFLQVAHSL